MKTHRINAHTTTAVFCLIFIVGLAQTAEHENAPADTQQEHGDLELSKRGTHENDYSKARFIDDFTEKFKELEEKLNDASDVDKRVAESVNKLENGVQFTVDGDEPYIQYGVEQDKRIPMGFRSQLGKRDHVDSDELEMERRAPMGFMGQLGKRDHVDSDELEMERRAPMGFMGQLGKRDHVDSDELEMERRAPMGFIGQLGKRDLDSDEAELEMERRAPMGYMSQLGKRAPMGYMSQLGKRLPMGFISQLGKRAPMGYMSQLGKRAPMGYMSQLGKRLPMGFISQLGKRIPMGFRSQLGKRRLPMGFASQLGKRRLPMGFASQLGKRRLPMGFASQLGKRTNSEMSNQVERDLTTGDDQLSDLFTDNDLHVRRRRSTHKLPWYISHRIIPTRWLRGIDRYSFVSRLGKRSHPSFGDM